MKNCIDCGAPLPRACKHERLILCAACIDRRGIETLGGFAKRMGITRSGVGYHRSNGMPSLVVGGLTWIPSKEAVRWIDARRTERQKPQRDWYRQGNDLRPGIIYALRCPKANQVRYVGKTGRSLQTRFRMHFADARKNRRRPVCSWIRKLAREGLKPIPEVLQECLPGMMDASEKEWIARYRAKGVRLLNVTEGGEGAVWSEEAKRKHSDRCADVNRHLSKDPAWQKANEIGCAQRRGMTLDQYREWKEQRVDEKLWNRLVHKYNMLLSRVRVRKSLSRRESRKIRVDGDVAYVPLTQGQTAMIDAEDAGRVGRYRWSALSHNGSFRAKTNLPGQKLILLHRYIMDAKPGEMVCFRDGTMLDCRKANLRIIEQFQGGRPKASLCYENRVRLDEAVT